MIGLMLMLTGVSRCALGSACPADEQIEAAIHNHYDPLLLAAYHQQLRDNPNGAVSPDDKRAKRAEHIERVSDVLCGDKLPSEFPGNPTVINCRFTLRYWDRDAYTTARMIQRNGNWEIDHILAVSRMRAPSH
eukprot:gene35752-48073_t